MFRDDMRAGDGALFYHSNAKEIGVVGEMVIEKPSEPDPTQFIKGHKYYDPKSTPEEPRWLGPVVRFAQVFPRVVTLDELKKNSIFADLPFVRKGNRLSVIPISKEQYQTIIRMAKINVR
jgi:predicted RNA-binding protein with PUA-like domain